MKVKMVDCTKRPVETVVKGVEVMIGKSIPRDDWEKTFLDLRKTGLQGVLEHINFVFQVEGASRAFTHQIVRYRAGISFSQESLRFVSKGGGGFKYYTPEGANCPEYHHAMDIIRDLYEELLAVGLKQEDARGVLPTNILTNINVAVNFRTLVNMAETRLCYQAQKGEWKDFFDKVKEEIKFEYLYLESERDCLLSFLKPICDRTRRCEFKSLFDRPCPLEGELDGC